MASNGPELLEKVAVILGCEARTIGGPDEARLGWLAVANRHPSAELAVLDIGGGSTEATRKGQGVSTPIGAVALLEDCGPDASACRARAQEAFAGFPEWGPLAWAAVGGTATALAMLELGLPQYDAEAIEGLQVSLASITGRIDSLARMTPDELLAIPGLGKGRADIVMPGLCILEAFLKQVGRDSAIISDRGIRYGLLVDWLRRRRKAAP
jgi:exopolyphosphatase/guanosine-5'-triphosphate,3'-diphosphate pyrophosphatase